MEWLILLGFVAIGLAWVRRYKPSWWEKLLSFNPFK
tara:strand:+ start:2853 stop:2960 length:108 start_codon:yes stop_codon:yes gene_type:complete